MGVSTYVQFHLRQLLLLLLPVLSIFLGIFLLQTRVLRHHLLHPSTIGLGFLKCHGQFLNKKTTLTDRNTVPIFSNLYRSFLLFVEVNSGTAGPQVPLQLVETGEDKAAPPALRLQLLLAPLVNVCQRNGVLAVLLAIGVFGTIATLVAVGVFGTVATLVFQFLTSG